MTATPTILVTGTSSGIGRAVAEAFVAAGWTTFATVRRREDAPPGAVPLVADVTVPASLAAAHDTVRIALEGGPGGGRPLDALVVNAGIARTGPLLHLPLDELRESLEVNVVGAVATVQAFVPLMRAGGRVVVISSVSGRLAAPLVGAYAASKHALEAVSDSLRRELSLLGIDVVVIEPGTIATPIWDKGLAGLDRYAHTPYRGPIAAIRQYLADSIAKALPPSRVAAAVRHALTTRRPRARYVVAARPLLEFWLPRWLPDRLLDRAVTTRFGLRPERS